MKKFLNIITAVVIAITFFGCEKDDICAGTTPTTPRLVIEFYDFNNPSVQLSVTNLKAQATGQSPVIFNQTAATDELKVRFTGVKISLPLDVTQESTTYTLTKNDDSTNPLVNNADIITINYSTREIYVSRACGYKTNFLLESITETGTAEEQWIRNITIEESNVVNEDETHVKIYF